MSSSTAVGRVTIALVAIFTAAILLHSQLSSALVTRGDSLAYWGEPSEARAMYARALFFDATNGTAADRYVFDSAISRDPVVVRSGVAVASVYLASFPNDGVVSMDRALCYQREGALTAAIADFRLSARIEKDPRALMFAALDERKLRHFDLAHALLKAAIGLDPKFEPARLELARL